MSATAIVRVTRKQLYEEVWSTSMRVLAPKYGLSDVGLAKICKKYEIPRPPVGYWAKVENGKAVHQPELPPTPEGIDETIEFHPKQPHVDHTATELPQWRFFDEQLKSLAARVGAGALVHAVGTDLRGGAVITRQTRDALRAAAREPTPDRYGGLQWPAAYGGPRVRVVASPEAQQRALLLLDAIVKTIDALGCKQRKPREEWDRSVVFELRETRFTLRIRERTRQVDHVLTEAEKQRKQKYMHSFAPKYDHVGTGDLIIELVREGWNKCFLQLKDGKRAGRVENRIAELALAVLHQADRDLAMAHQAKIAHQNRLVEEKRAREEAERRRIEEERREAELACQNRLLNMVEGWNAASHLRTFIAEVRSRLTEASLEEYDRDLLERWLRWASRVADERDPFRRPMEGLPEGTHPGIREVEQRERETPRDASAGEEPA